jgi:hypothetical protein
VTDLTKLPHSYIRCRTLGHAWDDVEPTAEEIQDADLMWHGYSLLATCCSRCYMRRMDIVTTGGALRTRRYNYPVGYLIAKGEHRPKRIEFRKQLIANRIFQMKAKRGKQ